MSIVANEHDESKSALPVIHNRALTHLADQIAAAHKAHQSHLKQSVAHAVTAGRLLTVAKEKVRHGEWLTWLQEKCHLSPRTAQAYMRVAKRFPDISKSATVAHLTLRDAMKSIHEGDRTRPSIVDHRTCPKCGEKLVRTSARYATCLTCDVRLYPIADDGFNPQQNPMLRLVEWFKRATVQDRKLFLDWVGRSVGRTNKLFGESMRALAAEMRVDL